MGKQAGGKLTGSHTTVIDAAEEIVKEACRRPEVTKVILGLIKAGVQGGNPGAKIVDIEHGLKVTVRGNTGIQEVFVYTSNRHATASALAAVAPKGRGRSRTKGRRKVSEATALDDPYVHLR